MVMDETTITPKAFSLAFGFETNIPFSTRQCEQIDILVSNYTLDSSFAISVAMTEMIGVCSVKCLHCIIIQARTIS